MHRALSPLPICLDHPSNNTEKLGQLINLVDFHNVSELQFEENNWSFGFQNSKRFENHRGCGDSSFRALSHCDCPSTFVSADSAATCSTVCTMCGADVLLQDMTSLQESDGNISLQKIG